MVVDATRPGPSSGRVAHTRASKHVDMGLEPMITPPTTLSPIEIGDLFAKIPCELALVAVAAVGCLVRHAKKAFGTPIMTRATKILTRA